MDQGFNQYNQPMQQNPTFVKDLVLSIFQICCCCQITGVLSLIFVILANSAFKQGNMIDYQAGTKRAKTTRIIGYILGGAITIGVTIFYVIAIVIGASSY